VRLAVGKKDGLRSQSKLRGVWSMQWWWWSIMKMIIDKDDENDNKRWLLMIDNEDDLYDNENDR
jgi:hypothetical protein